MESKNYLYPVALKWDQGPKELKKLKNKVQTYFQSEARSDGGECDIPDTDCSRGHILIYFKDKKAQRGVLKKNPHQIVIKDQTKLHLQVLSYREVMGDSFSSHHDSGDNDAPWPPEDTDHQQGKDQSPGTLKKKSDSHPDPGLVDEEPKRLREDSTGAFGGKEQKISFSAPVSWTGNEDKSPAASHPPRQEAGRNLLSHRSQEEPVEESPADLREIFMKVTARLDRKLFNEDLQEEIKAEIPSLTIKNDRDFVEVTGTYTEIHIVHEYLQVKLGVNAKKPSEPAGSEPPGSYTPGSGAPDKAEAFSPTDIHANQVCFPSALYEYIMEIYRSEVDTIKKRNNVRIDHRSSPEGNTVVTFIPQGPESSPEKAKDVFTDKVQKVMGDWSQERVDPSVVPLTFSDIKKQLKDIFSKILVLQEGNTDIILRGPRDELSRAIQSLKKGDYKPARPRRAPTISSGDIRTEIPVDPRHLDILKKLKRREICTIEDKYNVKMDEGRKNGSVLVTFRAVDATPDLSPHASHSFTTLLQKTFFNIEKKLINVKPEFQVERVSMLQEKLMMRGVDIVMEYSSGSVLLIGHPVHVAYAVEELSGSQNPGRDQAAAPLEEAMDTGGSSVDPQPKAEEPDKCPVCLCEMEDKVILPKCKHAYCKGCLQRLMAHKPVCAVCGVLYGKIKGDQPEGTMTDRTDRYSLPGYPGCGTIEIHYNISGGTQKENHPCPGKHFYGTSRTAYLPDNAEGRDVLRLLRKAFNQKLIFTVGESRTTGATDAVTWNDIHHKTSTSGGPQCFGYPDPDYLKRVRDELKAKGIE